MKCRMDHYAWVPAVTATGMEWATWHDLRHTFASRLAMMGHNEGTIVALLRHSTTALVKRYAHLSPSHLKAAIEGVSGFGKAAKERQELKVQDGKAEAVFIGTVTETVTTDYARERSIT